jgi:hypothetical protein
MALGDSMIRTGEDQPIVVMPACCSSLRRHTEVDGPVGLSEFSPAQTKRQIVGSVVAGLRRLVVDKPGLMHIVPGAEELLSFGIDVANECCLPWSGAPADRCLAANGLITKLSFSLRSGRCI